MKRNKLKNYIELALFKTAYYSMKLIPHKLRVPLYEYFITAIATTLRIRKDTVYKQLSDVFPNITTQELKKIYKNAWKNFARTAIEVYTIPSKKLYKNLKVNNFEHVKEALKEGRGAILITGHFSNWEVGGSWIADQGVPVSVVIKRLKNNFVNDFTNAGRKKHGIEIIYMKQALRGILRSLKQNKVVCMLIDQAAGKTGYQLPFLGKNASVHAGAAKIALKNDTPIIVIMTVRHPDGSYEMNIENPIFPSTLPKNMQNEKELMIKIQSRLEAYIKQYPEQWFWMHRRWKGASKAKQWEK